MHKINKFLDKDLDKKPCDSDCPNYRFDHLETACILSDVFSVKKGQPCAIYVEEIEKGKAK